MTIKECILLPASEIVHVYQQQTMADHPFLARLRREPVNLAAIWLLAVNVKEGASKHFARWLAGLIIRIQDDRIRSVIATQLNDELGRGDFSSIHTVLLDQLIAGLEPWRLAEVSEEILVPGRNFYQQNERLYCASDPYIAMGALIASEICAEQIQLCLGHEVRRQNLIEASALTWLTLHEELEVEHAEEALVIANLIPNSDAVLNAVWRGAEGMHKAITTFLDDLYRICFA